MPHDYWPTTKSLDATISAVRDQLCYGLDLRHTPLATLSLDAKRLQNGAETCLERGLERTAFEVRVTPDCKSKNRPSPKQ